MKFPKMTPRRWFWSAMAVGAVWAFAGWRWDGRQTSWLAAVQGGLSQPVETAAIPPGFILTSAQISVQNALHSVAGTAPPASSGDLNQRVIDLENENAQLKSLLMEFKQREQALGYLHLVHIEPEDVLPATVVGFQAGPGASTLWLDKGALNNVKAGAVVVAPLEQVHLLGRVVKVDQAECMVRLVSDPSMKTQCQLVRPLVLPAGSPEPAQNLAVTPETCLAEGMGDGTLQITNVDVDAAQPQKGDLVCLTDGSWPAKVQHMVLGQVDAVGKRLDQPRRYQIRVVPRITVSAQRTVMIVVRE